MDFPNSASLIFYNLYYFLLDKSPEKPVFETMIFVIMWGSDTTQQAWMSPTTKSKEKPLFVVYHVHTHTHTHTHKTSPPFSTELSVFVGLIGVSSWAGRMGVLFVEQRRKLSWGERGQQGGCTRNKRAQPHTLSAKGGTHKSLSPPPTGRAPHSPWAWRKPTFGSSIAQGHHWLSTHHWVD